MNFLYSLLVIDAPVAVPCICLGQFLRSVELPEAIVDADPFHNFVSARRYVLILVLKVFIVNESIEARVEGPAFSVIELYKEFKF